MLDADGRLGMLTLEQLQATDIAEQLPARYADGAGHIQGFGSADPLSEENFFDCERTTYYGRVLAVVRAGEAEGTIKLHAEAEGVEPVSIEIQVK